MLLPSSARAYPVLTWCYPESLWHLSTLLGVKKGQQNGNNPSSWAGIIAIMLPSVLHWCSLPHAKKKKKACWELLLNVSCVWLIMECVLSPVLIYKLSWKYSFIKIHWASANPHRYIEKNVTTKSIFVTTVFGTSSEFWCFTECYKSVTTLCKLYVFYLIVSLQKQLSINPKALVCSRCTERKLDSLL